MKFNVKHEWQSDDVSSQCCDCFGYRNSTVQKWHDKTHLMSSKVGKGFEAFDQSVLKQIQQVMNISLLASY